jgi:solute:Na+ symporter, SSS family
MLLIGIGCYIVFTVAIGIWVSRRVHTAEDFLLAGRSLPLGLTTATFFATWFGSETVMGASSQMAHSGLLGVIEDPFGAALCLVLIGLIFARPLYRMQLNTFGDFFRERYGRTAEAIAGVMLIVSYLGWVAAQFIAIGLLANLMLGLPVAYGVIGGASVVVLYTFWGGLWAVAVLDFVQNIVIVTGLLIVLVYLIPLMDFPKAVDAMPTGYFRFTPEGHTPTVWLNYFAAWITIGLGSIPQQDVFQRINAAKSERVAVRGAYLGAVLYLTVGMIPLFIAMYARTLEPSLLAGDPQQLIIRFIMDKTPLLVQLMFIGALISAIMSTASGAMIAPAAILSENVFGRKAKLGNLSHLWVSRLAVLLVALASLTLALSRENIYELVGESSALSLVSLFVPFCFGLVLRRHSSVAAIVSMVMGLVAWQLASISETDLNPLLYGLLASLVGFGIGFTLNKHQR